MIRYLQHQHIDKRWWDQQLLRCPNRMWYAQSWVLDLTSPGWEAYVDDVSGAIMPLTWRRKLFFKYLFQPYGSQQLGVFAPEYSDALGGQFILQLTKNFSFCDIVLNEAMGPMDIPGTTLLPMQQQVLSLEPAYEELRKGYSTGHRRNLGKGAEGGEVSPGIDPGLFCSLFVRTTATRFKSGSNADHAVMASVIRNAVERGQATVLGIQQDQELFAAACFMQWEGRAIFYKSANDAKGRDLKGMFRIVDHFIRTHAGSGPLLDFAGSNTPSVARFNSGFGAEGRIYLHLKRNKLPPPFKWFKK